MKCFYIVLIGCLTIENLIKSIKNSNKLYLSKISTLEKWPAKTSMAETYVVCKGGSMKRIYMLDSVPRAGIG